MLIWKVPAAHAVQAGWPMLDENVPALHLCGATLPVVQKLPMGHARHCVSFVISVRLEYRPAGHGSTDEVPSGQKDPAVHGSHCAAPRPLWNLPPGQAMQVGKPSLGVCVPALQSSGCSLPARHLLPAGQGEHCEVLTRPVAFDHVPAGHAVAIELPLGHT